ncbi:hypothetical protein VCRA2119O147_140042 [Vibrio crassostreae]|nr:hypothetical protein VCRA2113O221_100041 [Vibrio crassostreae]CAK1695888.1 hypothetical protein VCRA2114E123_100041 [Vibrio crassostreae]CAK1697306.1 hypothetical protein VCRA2113O119_100057 [Vibrio crassostreae]CAK1705393.1 hypothetical protein VCRA2118O239_100132 [Vibrio crassostreae]CAK1705682.1 hypothetical protein VCRA2113O196_100131 [Vibrio crassostreae]
MNNCIYPPEITQFKQKIPDYAPSSLLGMTTKLIIENVKLTYKKRPHRSEAFRIICCVAY